MNPLLELEIDNLENSDTEEISFIDGDSSELLQFMDSCFVKNYIEEQDNKQKLVEFASLGLLTTKQMTSVVLNGIE